MNFLRSFLALAAVSLTLQPAAGQLGADKGGGSGGLRGQTIYQAGLVLPQSLPAAEEYAEQAKMRVERAADLHKMATESFRAGTSGAAEMRNAETELKLSESAYREAVRNLNVVRRADRLSQRVDLDLKDSTLSQAAQALSQVSQIPIRVDKGVRTDKRLNASAKGARTADVLQTIAKQLGLQVAPEDENGIVIRSWPSLSVNGVEKAYIDANAPWSQEWLQQGGTNPAYLTSAYTDALKTYGINSGQTAKGSQSPYSGPGSNQQVKGPLSQAYSGLGSNQLGTGSLGQSFYGLGGSSQSSGLTMTSVGNQVVVAEPGPGPRGEVGLWLTVYQLRGTQLIKQSTLFHKARGGK